MHRCPCTCLLPFRDLPFRDQSFLQRQPTSNGSVYVSKPPSAAAATGKQLDGQQQRRTASKRSDDVARKFGVISRLRARKGNPEPEAAGRIEGGVEGELGASLGAGIRANACRRKAAFLTCLHCPAPHRSKVQR